MLRECDHMYTRVLCCKGPVCWNINHRACLTYAWLTVGSVSGNCFVGLYLFLEGLNRVRSLVLPKGLDYFLLCSAQLSCGLRQDCSNGYSGVWSGDLFIVWLNRGAFSSFVKTVIRRVCLKFQVLNVLGLIILCFCYLKWWLFFITKKKNNRQQRKMLWKHDLSCPFIPTGNLVFPIHLTFITECGRKFMWKNLTQQRRGPEMFYCEARQ